MKKRLLISTCFFFISLSCLCAQTKPLKEFRGIKWESSQSTAIAILSSQHIVNTPASESGDSDRYTEIVQSDKDQDGISEVSFDEWWPGQWSNPVYTLKFLNDRFEYVNLSIGDGIDGFHRAYDILLHRYGKPTKTVQRAKTAQRRPEPKYIWGYSNVLVTLHFLPSDEGEVTTSGKSEITFETKSWIKHEANQKEADEKRLIETGPKF